MLCFEAFVVIFLHFNRFSYGCVEPYELYEEECFHKITPSSVFAADESAIICSDIRGRLANPWDFSNWEKAKSFFKISSSQHIIFGIDISNGQLISWNGEWMRARNESLGFDLHRTGGGSLTNEMTYIDRVLLEHDNNLLWESPSSNPEYVGICKHTGMYVSIIRHVNAYYLPTAQPAIASVR